MWEVGVSRNLPGDRDGQSPCQDTPAHCLPPPDLLLPGAAWLAPSLAPKFPLWEEEEAGILTLTSPPLWKVPEVN